MRIAVGSDHAGFDLKADLARHLAEAGHEVFDFGTDSAAVSVDYPIYGIAVARAVAEGRAERGVCVCGTGIGISISANKVAGVRAALIHDIFSAHQGVEDDDMNILCLGGKVIGPSLAIELVNGFLAARFSGLPRHRRRLSKVAALENAHSDT